MLDFGIMKWLSEIEAAVLGCWKVEKLSTGMPSLSCWSPSQGDLKKLEFHWFMASYLWDLPSLLIVVLWCDLWSVHHTAVSCCKVLSKFFPLASKLYKYLVPRLWCSRSMHCEKLWELHGSATPVTGKVMRGLSKEWVIEVCKNPSKLFFLFFYRRISELKFDPAFWVWNDHGCMMNEIFIKAWKEIAQWQTFSNR